MVSVTVSHTDLFAASMTEPINNNDYFTLALCRSQTKRIRTGSTLRGPFIPDLAATTPSPQKEAEVVIIVSASLPVIRLPVSVSLPTLIAPQVDQGKLSISSLSI